MRSPTGQDMWCNPGKDVHRGPVTRQIVPYTHLGDELLTGLTPIAKDHTKGLLPLFVEAQVATLGAAQCSCIFVHVED